MDPEKKRGPENPQRTPTSPVHMPDTHSLCSEAAWWTVSKGKRYRKLAVNTQVCVCMAIKFHSFSGERQCEAPLNKNILRKHNYQRNIYYFCRQLSSY